MERLRRPCSEILTQYSLLANVLPGCSGVVLVFSHLLLERHAERCIQLAYQCQNKNAERILRLLAVDLMLAAELQRPRAAKDELAELARLSRTATVGTFKSESASTA